jgi:ribosomal subunit interface protein
MNTPLQVTYRDIDSTEAIDAYVRRKAEKLERLGDRRLLSCRVAIESPHRSRIHGRDFRVLIEATVPGKSIVISKNGHDQDLYAAIDTAFDEAVRRVTGELRRRGEG